MRLPHLRQEPEYTRQRPGGQSWIVAIRRAPEPGYPRGAGAAVPIIGLIIISHQICDLYPCFQWKLFLAST